VGSGISVACWKSIEYDNLAQPKRQIRCVATRLEVVENGNERVPTLTLTCDGAEYKSTDSKLIVDIMNTAMATREWPGTDRGKLVFVVDAMLLKSGKVVSLEEGVK
jgi:hypothetical protein